MTSPEKEYRSPIFLRGAVRILGAKLVTELAILPAQALTLLLEVLQIAVLLSQLILQFGNLTGTTGLVELVGLLAFGLGIAFVIFDLLFKPECVQDHGIGSVEDEREEEGETAEVHVALGVKFAGLHFHARRALHHSGSTSFVSFRDSQGSVRHGPLTTVFVRGQLDLNPINSIDAINE